MDNKIYITNFWWAANYGANLTAYAINQIVSNSYLVDNSDCYQLIRESSFSFHKNFKKKYFNKIEKLCNIKNMDSLTFIVGSDQVFRPIINKNISETFMLNYAQPNSKKIAFSASFGVDKEQFVKENSQDTIAKMKNSLKSFDFISVREKSGVEICKDIFDIDAQWIIDPVFILEKAYYLELINNVSSTSKYKNKIVAHFVANKNTKINKYNDKKVIKLHNSNISVEEWLNAIRDCELLIADSYHAVCFAIIFNKPFIAITQQKHGRARFESLFEMLGVENQCIDSINEIYEKDCVFKVDYAVVNERIEQERQKGLEFLKTALEAPVEITQEKIDSRITYLENRVKELEIENNLKFQLKKYLWEKWLIIYHVYLPTPIKNIIHIFWQIIKGEKRC